MSFSVKDADFKEWATCCTSLGISHLVSGIAQLSVWFSCVDKVGASVLTPPSLAVANPNWRWGHQGMHNLLNKLRNIFPSKWICQFLHTIFLPCGFIWYRSRPSLQSHSCSCKGLKKSLRNLVISYWVPEKCTSSRMHSKIFTTHQGYLSILYINYIHVILNLHNQLNKFIAFRNVTKLSTHGHGLRNEAQRDRNQSNKVMLAP